LLLTESTSTRKMDEITFSGFGNNQDIQIDDQGSVLPGYVPYLSLVYKLIATTVILLLSGWVVFTIKVTKSLHKPHNIFVANLLISGMMTALSGCLIASTMIISFQLGVKSLVSCFAYKYRLLPLHVNNMSFMIIAADKVFAIKYPFKYRRKMKPRVVAAVVVGVWLIALIPTVQTIIFDISGYISKTEYGTCLADGTAFLEAVIIFITPIILSPILTIILNIYLAIKAHHIHRQIEKETKLAGTIDSPSERMTALKKKQSGIKRHRKPLITLLVIVLGSTFIGLTFTPLYLLGRFLIGSQGYQDLMELVVAPNMPYLVLLLQPLVYGLYFKQVREPMMKHLKRIFRINKMNTVAPQLPRTAWM